MPQENQEVADDLDIVGQEIAYSERGGNGDGKWRNVAGEEMDLREGVFYPGVLTSIEPSVHAQWGPQFVFRFDFEGSQYTWKGKNGKVGQFGITKKTGRTMGPKTALYKLYSTLVRELKEGDVVGKTAPGLRSMIGMPVNMAIKPKRFAKSDGTMGTTYTLEVLAKRAVAETTSPSSSSGNTKSTPQVTPSLATKSTMAVSPVEKPAPSVVKKTEQPVNVPNAVSQIEPTTQTDVVDIFEDII